MKVLILWKHKILNLASLNAHYFENYERTYARVVLAPSGVDQSKFYPTVMPRNRDIWNAWLSCISRWKQNKTTTTATNLMQWSLTGYISPIFIITINHAAFLHPLRERSLIETCKYALTLKWSRGPILTQHLAQKRKDFFCRCSM